MVGFRMDPGRENGSLVFAADLEMDWCGGDGEAGEDGGGAGTRPKRAMTAEDEQLTRVCPCLRRSRIG